MQVLVAGTHVHNITLVLWMIAHVHASGCHGLLNPVIQSPA